MLDIRGMRFPIDVILVCIRAYAAYPLSDRHLVEMMQERGLVVDHSSINRRAILFLPLLAQWERSYNLTTLALLGKSTVRARHAGAWAVDNHRRMDLTK